MEMTMQGLLPLYRYFEFSGRSGRAEYWQWVAITTVAGWVTGILDALQSTPYDPSHKFTMILGLMTLVPNVAVGIRRFHDRGKSGWYYAAFCLLLGLAVILLVIGSAIQARNGDDSFIGVGVVVGVAWFVYAIYAIVQLAKPGDPHANAYGEPSSQVAPAIDLGATVREVQASFASSAPARPDVDPLEQIERLAKLRDAGMLTDEEFQQQKAACLSRLS